MDANASGLVKGRGRGLAQAARNEISEAPALLARGAVPVQQAQKPANKKSDGAARSEAGRPPSKRLTSAQEEAAKASKRRRPNASAAVPPKTDLERVRELEAELNRLREKSATVSEIGTVDQGGEDNATRLKQDLQRQQQEQERLRVRLQQQEEEHQRERQRLQAEHERLQRWQQQQQQQQSQCTPQCTPLLRQPQSVCTPSSQLAPSKHTQQQSSLSFPAWDTPEFSERPLTGAQPRLPPAPTPGVHLQPELDPAQNRQAQLAAALTTDEAEEAKAFVLRLHVEALHDGSIPLYLGSTEQKKVFARAAKTYKPLAGLLKVRA